MMAKTMILPAALRYQAEVATAVNATKAAGVDNSAQADLLKSLTATITEFQKATVDAGQGPGATTPRASRSTHAKYMPRSRSCRR